MAFPVINFGQFIAISIIYIIIMGLIIWNNASAWGSAGGFFGSIATTIQMSWWFFGLMAVWLIVGSVFVSKADRINIRDYFTTTKHSALPPPYIPEGGEELPTPNPMGGKRGFVQYNRRESDW